MVVIYISVMFSEIGPGRFEILLKAYLTKTVPFVHLLKCFLTSQLWQINCEAKGKLKCVRLSPSLALTLIFIKNFCSKKFRLIEEGDYSVIR